MRILNWILNILLLICVTSCINHTEITDDSHSLLAISVKDIGFTPENNQKTTRAIDNGYATTFTNGDQIGLYVLDASGNVKMANLCLTYDGTNWNYPAGTTLYYDDISRKYFAYYPYQNTITGIPTTSAATTATSFFSTLISNWQPSTDQSSQAKYTTSDLMVGTGVVGTLVSNATRPMTFNMTHQMALVDMNFPYYYLSTDNNYTYTLGLTGSSFKPFHLSKGNYRYIIKPATNTSIWGYYCTATSNNTSQIFNKAFSVAAGAYQIMNVDNISSATSYTIKTGDYLLEDGSIIPNGTTNKYLLSKAIAVIFSTSTSTIDKGYGWTHGYAMALKNTANNTVWSTRKDQIFNVSTDINTIALYESDMDGYSHSQTIKNIPDYITAYPALNAAFTYNVAPPNNTSGWYLPSVGQWFLILKNLGGITWTLDYDAGSYGYWNSQHTDPTTGSNTNPAIIAANGINRYLRPVSDTTIPTNAINLFWSSSEYSNDRTCSISFGTSTDGYLFLSSTLKTDTSSSFKIYSAIAF